MHTHRNDKNYIPPRHTSYARGITEGLDGLNCSHEFKGVIVKIVCVLEIQFKSAWALTNVT